MCVPVVVLALLVAVVLVVLIVDVVVVVIVVVVVEVDVTEAFDFADCKITVDVVGAVGLAGTGELIVGIAV
jgi:hypothetical protein